MYTRIKIITSSLIFLVFQLKIDGEWSPIIYKSNIFYLYIVEPVKQQ